MLTLVKPDNEAVTKEAKAEGARKSSNVVSLTSRSRTKEKSQLNVLRAAKKLKW